MRFLSKRFYRRFKRFLIQRESASFFKGLKDSFRGQRGFVIGNGPSLRLDDLNQLVNEVTLASNKIFLAFEHVSWRPTIYSVADDVLWPKIYDEVQSYFRHVLLPEWMKPDPRGIKAIRWRSLGGFAEVMEPDPRLFSGDASVGLFEGCTVTYNSLQVAVHMGLNPIYIIGCDHNYKGEGNVERNNLVEAPQDSNHFMPGYRKAGELVNPAPIQIMECAYRTARLYGDRNGVSILNATRGGFLDVFERVDFDSLF